MIKNLETLRDKILTLEPFDLHNKAVIDYFWSIVQRYEYNTIKTKEEGLEILDRVGRFFWLVKGNNIAGGVIFLAYVTAFDEWTFHAYCDMDVARSIDKKGHLPYRAANLVVNWFFENKAEPVLYTMHDVRNRAATRLCKSLGFQDGGKKIIPEGEFITMFLTRGKHELRRKFHGDNR